ncbi:MAG: UvrD-helicase domain-containing protein [Eubacteriales bacterium]
MNKTKSKFNFTPDQLSAINAEDKTLIVSAGAGSGKTTVLTQRVIETVKKGVDITEILVTTFTKAAAADIKDKLYSSVVAALAENPSDGRLSRALYLLPSAKISTIHSFCLDIVRTNFASLSIPPSLRVADDAESGMILENCLEDLIDDMFENQPEGENTFIEMCDAFAGEKDLNKLKTTVLDVYRKYRAFPFWKRFISESGERAEAQLVLASEKGFFAADIGKELLENVKSQTSALIREMQAIKEELIFAAASESNLKSAVTQIDFLNELSVLFEKTGLKFEDILAKLNAYPATRINKKNLPEDLQSAYQNKKSAIDTVVKAFKKAFSTSEEEVLRDFKKSVRLNRVTADFIFRLDDAYAKSKLSHFVLDYSDIESLTLALLAEHTKSGVVRTKLCLELQSGFKQIFIDEYQDINPLQDLIFRLISKENNRFMVGDLKQSIYRFRNASPDIFQSYLREFGTLDGGGDKAKIYLTQNHRSRKPILDFVNIIFERLYTEKTVGVSYEDERLTPPEDAEVGGFPVELTVFTLDKDIKTTLKHTEIEAEYVAEKIAFLVSEAGGGYMYRDIALLMRAVSNGSRVFEESLLKRGIPYTLEKSDGFLLEPEVLLAMSLLGVIDNVFDDISLAASLRSPVYRFTAEELYQIKSFYARQTLYGCLVCCAGDFVRHANRDKKYKPTADFRLAGRKQRFAEPRGKRAGSRPGDGVGEKCKNFIEEIKSLARLGGEDPTSRLIWRMYQKTGLIAICAAEKNGEIKKNNLLALYNLALEYEKTSFKGLSSFLDYIGETAKAPDDRPGEDGGNAVKIMSIHKSKGMEFKVCFVSALGKKFNFKDLNKNYIVRPDGFVFYNLRSGDGIFEYKPLVKEIARNTEKKAVLKEELRCLYVALTRAKERLFVTGAAKAVKTDLYGDEGGAFYEVTTPLGWLIPIFSRTESISFNFRIIKGLPEVPDTYERSEPPAGEEQGGIPEEIYKDALDFVYPYGEGFKIPAKAAVSELRLGILEDDEYIRLISKGMTKTPFFARPEKAPVAVGLATHLFMQFADFGGALEYGVEEEIKRLVDIKMISEEEGKLIDAGAVEVFLRSGLCGEILASGEVWREKRFNLIEDASLVSKTSGESVMIQGVIDCFYKNPGGDYTVVDYKTDRLPKGGEQILIDRHITQIGYYCRAVEKMTGGRVSRALLYSFSLGREIDVTIAVCEDER